MDSRIETANTDLAEAEKLSSSWRVEAELQAIRARLTAILGYARAGLLLYAFSLAYHLMKG